MKIEAGQVAVVTGGTSGIGFGAGHRPGAARCERDDRRCARGRDPHRRRCAVTATRPSCRCARRCQRRRRCGRAGRRDHRTVRPGGPRVQQRGRGGREAPDVGAAAANLALADRRQADGRRARCTDVRAAVHRAGLRALSQHRIRGRFDAAAHPRALQRDHARGRRADRDVGCRTESLCQRIWARPYCAREWWTPRSVRTPPCWHRQARRRSLARARTWRRWARSVPCIVAASGDRRRRGGACACCRRTRRGRSGPSSESTRYWPTSTEITTESRCHPG